MPDQQAAPPTPSSSAPRADNWAKPVHRLSVDALPADAINLNVAGRQLTGPLKGFGQLWQKTYRIELTGTQLAPTEIIRLWKAHFPEFWPGNNRFYGSLAGINAGDVAVLNLA
ncbi:MAG: hypothetical protein KDD83_02710, partial [Caldilineaceae bacterium]|nr:hypothetical protein [Caldilineaceae bacterium]